MGRQLRRVPLDFAWPLDQPWEGFLNPHYDRSSQCPHCAGSGESPQARRLHSLWYGYIPFRPEDRGSVPFTPDNPAIRSRAERNIDSNARRSGAMPEAAIATEAQRLCDHYNKRWCYHLNDDDVAALVREGRLMDFTHTWTPGEGWKSRETVVMPTAAEVNAWALNGMGHDSINAWAVIKAELERRQEESRCEHCQGEGRLWPSEQAKQACEDWQPVEPPTGAGYQLWETVSEGSPVSPVFDSAEGLARWLASNLRGSVTDGTSYDKWMAFILGPGWAPSFIGGSGGLVSGVEAMADAHLAESGTRLLT